MQIREKDMNIKASLKWTDGFQFVGRAGDGPGVVIDSTDGGSGPTPMDMLLMGVAGCTGIDVILIMQKKRANITDFKINITGEKAEKEPKRFTKIHIEYLFYGTNIREKGVEQAIRLSENKLCSAMASLNAEFTHSYKIIKTDNQGEKP